MLSTGANFYKEILPANDSNENDTNNRQKTESGPMKLGMNSSLDPAPNKKQHQLNIFKKMQLKQAQSKTCNNVPALMENRSPSDYVMDLAVPPELESSALLSKTRTSVICAFCNYACSKIGRMKIHLLTHSDKNPYKCTVCGFAFSDASKYKIHKAEHEIKVYSCSVCTYSSPDEKGVKKHETIHDPLYMCDHCNFTTKIQSTLKSHMLSHTIEKSYKCTVCDYNCENSLDLSAHMNVHNFDDIYSCGLCTFSSPTKEDLEYHEKIHCNEKNLEKDLEEESLPLSQMFKLKRNPKEKRFMCDYCQKILKNKGSLTNHIKKHMRIQKLALLKDEKPKYSKDKFYVCDYCRLTFTNKGNLTCHIRKHMRIQKLAPFQNLHEMKHAANRPFACNKCPYRSITKAYLEYHKLIHLKMKRYECDHCGEKFHYKWALKNHISKHMQLKYPCNLCNFRTSQRKFITHHLKTKHPEERPFACQECPYRGISSTHLYYHKFSHSKIKAFKCDYCGADFKYRGSLVDHILKHMGIKNYVCDKCPYRAIQRVSLTNHQKTVHSEDRPFACDECSLRFITKTFLERHKKLKHSEFNIFKCEHCPYQCHFKTALKIHNRRHTNERPYPCILCKYRGRQCQALSAHYRARHRKEYKLMKKTNMPLTTIKYIGSKPIDYSLE